MLVSLVPGGSLSPVAVCQVSHKLASTRDARVMPDKDRIMKEPRRSTKRETKRKKRKEGRKKGRTETRQEQCSSFDGTTVKHPLTFVDPLTRFFKKICKSCRMRLKETMDLDSCMYTPRVTIDEQI